MSCSCGWSCFHFAESWTRFCRSTGRDQWKTGAFRWKDGIRNGFDSHDSSQKHIWWMSLDSRAVLTLHLMQSYLHTRFGVHPFATLKVCWHVTGRGSKRWALVLAAVWKHREVAKGSYKNCKQRTSTLLSKLQEASSNFGDGTPRPQFLCSHLTSWFHPVQVQSARSHLQEAILGDVFCIVESWRPQCLWAAPRSKFSYLNDCDRICT